ncbi:MAG: hypothetical protein ACAH65_08300 [Chloroflexota bacterium]
MNYTNLGLGNQLQDLSYMEEEQRARRLAEGAELAQGPNPMRVATGRALVSIGARLMGEPSPTSGGGPLRAAAR